MVPWLFRWDISKPTIYVTVEGKVVPLFNPKVTNCSCDRFIMLFRIKKHTDIKLWGAAVRLLPSLRMFLLLIFYFYKLYHDYCVCFVTFVYVYLFLAISDYHFSRLWTNYRSLSVCTGVGVPPSVSSKSRRFLFYFLMWNIHTYVRTHVHTYIYTYICTYITYVHSYIYIHTYTWCPRRKGSNFGRVFLRSNYTDITQNTYTQSSMVTEILAREIWNFNSYYSLIDYQIHIETGRNMWFL